MTFFMSHHVTLTEHFFQLENRVSLANRPPFENKQRPLLLVLFTNSEKKKSFVPHKPQLKTTTFSFGEKKTILELVIQCPDPLVRTCRLSPARSLSAVRSSVSPCTSPLSFPIKISIFN